MSLDRIKGILIGTAVGDAIGLPMEGMSPKRIQRLGWIKETKPLRHHFLFGKGMWSDDTEHMIMLTQSLVKSGGDLKKFQRSFSWELRWWLLGLPAGVGLATARAIIKLWLGFPISHSGVFSAGNGSAMRTAMIAAYFPNDKKKRQAFTIAQSKVTHTDPKATIGAMAITEIIAHALNHEQLISQQGMIDLLKAIGNVKMPRMKGLDIARSDWTKIIQLMNQGWNENWNANLFLTSLHKLIGANSSRGVTGYIYQTVPIAIYVGFLEKWNFQKTIQSVISLGGDTDTVAAIAGAMCGAFKGVEKIPQKWRFNVTEWPCSMPDLEKLAIAVAEKKKIRIRARFSIPLLLRNSLFLGVVLVHGLARLLPR